MNKEFSPRWVSITSSSLVGWNIALISAFLMAILISAILRSIGLSLSSGLEIALIGILSIGGSILIGVYVGKKINRKFKNCKMNIGYLWLGFLIVVTALSFPAPFGYIIK